MHTRKRRRIKPHIILAPKVNVDEDVDSCDFEHWALLRAVTVSWGQGTHRPCMQSNTVTQCMQSNTVH